jgi:ATP-dependent Lon protease
VRNLERELMTLARKAVTEILRTDKETVEVTPDNLDDYLGVRVSASARSRARTRSVSSPGSPGPRSAANC